MNKFYTYALKQPSLTILKEFSMIKWTYLSTIYCEVI